MARLARSAIRRLRGRAGFTLIELLLVLLIIGLLAAMVVPRLAGRSQQARIAAAKADVESNLSVALDLYELDNGVYPTTEQGLEALIHKPDIPPIPPAWEGPYIKNARLPTDPWGNPYQYAFPGENNEFGYDLFSFGPDQVPGGGDDITNWMNGGY